MGTRDTTKIVDEIDATETEPRILSPEAQALHNKLVAGKLAFLQEQTDEATTAIEKTKLDMLIPLNAGSHRTLNTICSFISICLLVVACYVGYEKLRTIEVEEYVEEEIIEIVAHEGYRACRYKDSLGFNTIGFGHLIKTSEIVKYADDCITGEQAIALLRADYSIAVRSVKERYSWATPREQMILVNMTYQMGPAGLSKFKLMLAAFKDDDYDSAAGEVMDSNYRKQTPRRASQMAARIMALKKDL